MPKHAFTFRLDSDLVAQVDQARALVSRTAWVENALRIVLAMREALDEAKSAKVADSIRAVAGEEEAAQAGRAVPSSMPKKVGSPLDIPTVRRARELVTDEEALRAYRRVAGRKKWS